LDFSISLFLAGCYYKDRRWVFFVNEPFFILSQISEAKSKKWKNLVQRTFSTTLTLSFVSQSVSFTQPRNHIYGYWLLSCVRVSSQITLTLNNLSYSHFLLVYVLLFWKEPFAKHNPFPFIWSFLSVPRFRITKF